MTLICLRNITISPVHMFLIHFSTSPTPMNNKLKADIRSANVPDLLEIYDTIKGFCDDFLELAVVKAIKSTVMAHFICFCF